ncbi:MAG: hypothetical protein JNL73_23100 [Anaerolineales bacterium]|nr:hypothetical protein [Anaerolineales bacterium]
MATEISGPEVSIQDVRSQLAQQLALTLIVAGLAWISLTWPNPAIQAALSVPLGLAVIAIGWGARALHRHHAPSARRLLAFGLSLGLLAAMTQWPMDWLPFLGIALAFVSGLLVTGGGIAATALTLSWAVVLDAAGIRTYAVLELGLALAFAAVLAWQTARTVYTAHGWVWSSQQRADQLLREARDYQAELARVLKSLDSSNQILRRTQNDLIAARKQAESAESAKSQFVANISHELTTPLNLIVGFSEVMHLTPEVYGDAVWPPTLRRDVYQIYRSSRHLLGLIDDVFDLSRFDMVGFALNRELTPLGPLLHDTAEFARDLFQGRPVRFDVEIPNDLPAVDIDRTRIRQVLLNLLNNARHFTVSGSVRLVAEVRGAEVVVGVQDTGPGIPNEKLARVFEEFYQVDPSLRRQHGGAGLGLSISKRFVEAHHGRIWAESTLGQGTLFAFALPIAEHAPAVAATFRPVEPTLPETRPCVLVVDPDPRVVGLLRHHLGQYEVIQLRSVSEIVEAVALHQPRAVVHNVRPDAPDHDRPGVRTPVIRCSLPSQSWLARDFDVAACLAKPVTAEAVMDEVRRLGGARHALVVAQDRGFCQLIERMLAAGVPECDVSRAYDVEEARQTLRAGRIDVILLDDGSLDLLGDLRREAELGHPAVIVLVEADWAETDAIPRGREVALEHPDGLSSVQTLRCVEAAIEALGAGRYVPDEATVS